MKHMFKLPLVAVAALASSPAFAHPGSAAHTFADGMAHPLTGADHLMVMIAVGLFAATRPLSRAWQAPAVFLSLIHI